MVTPSLITRLAAHYVPCATLYWHGHCRLVLASGPMRSATRIAKVGSTYLVRCNGLTLRTRSGATVVTFVNQHHG